MRETAEALAQAIADSGFPAFLEHGLAGRPILSHHRFQAAVAGCPKACSQPQIQDFGVIGVAAIEISADLCDGCLRCVNACREEAVAVSERIPAIHRALTAHMERGKPGERLAALVEREGPQALLDAGRPPAAAPLGGAGLYPANWCAD